MLALLFEIGGERYALPARRVKEVTRVPEARAVPGAPEWIAGVFARGEEWVPLIDLARLIAGVEAPRRAATRVAIVERTRGSDRRNLGLMAPGMTRVIDVTEFLATGLHVPERDFLGAIAPDADRGVQVIEIDRVLPAEIDDLLFGGTRSAQAAPPARGDPP